MKPMNRLAAAFLAAALCAAAPASAGMVLGGTRSAGNSYARFQAGAFSSGGDTSWSVYGAYGYYVLQNVALEGSAGFYNEDRSYGDLTIWPLSLSIKAGVPLEQFFPYVLAGVDVQYIDADDAGRNDSDTATGYHVGAGAEFDLSRNVYMGIEYRYTFLETDLFGRKRDLDGGEMAFSLGFRF